jgi:hypothetical protein
MILVDLLDAWLICSTAQLLLLLLLLLLLYLPDPAVLGAVRIHGSSPRLEICASDVAASRASQQGASPHTATKTVNEQGEVGSAKEDPSFIVWTCSLAVAPC